MSAHDDWPLGPPIPRTAQVLRWLRAPTQFLDDCAATYGDCFVVRLASAPPIVVLGHPEAVRDVLQVDERHRAGQANAALAPLLGRGSLLLLDGAPHRVARSQMRALFRRPAAFTSAMRDAVDGAIDTWTVGRPFCLHQAMRRMAVDVILGLILGQDASPAIRDVLLDLLAAAGRPFVNVPWASAERGRAKPWGRMARLRRDLDGLLTLALAHASGPLTERGDPALIRDQIVTILVAGHETTATALAWLFQRVLADPVVVRQLHASGLAFDVDAGTPASGYLDAVVDESLRLDPVFFVIGRVLEEPLSVGRFRLPRGAIAAPCMYLVHRHPDVWPDPLRFDPSRFLVRRPGPHEFLPFGGGIRRCVGMGLARLEMKVVLARVLARTRLRLLEPTRPSVRRAVTNAPAGGVPVVLESRRDGTVEAAVAGRWEGAASTP